MLPFISSDVMLQILELFNEEQIPCPDGHFI